MKKPYKRLLWIRTESNFSDERAPLSPRACHTLIKLGHKVTVETSAIRIFKDSEYKEVGCEMASPGSWVAAPTDAFIIGLENLAVDTFPLNHRHIFFADAYKGKTGARELLKRFIIGGGKLYDLDYLIDQKDERVVSLGHFAGFIGAAIALKLWSFKKLNIPLEELAPFMPYSDSETFLEKVGGYLDLVGEKPKALILGYKGAAGKGAQALCRNLGIDFEGWGRKESSNAHPQSYLDYDILINSVLIDKATKPFLTKTCLENNKRLSIIADISRDPTGPYNPLPLYDSCSNFKDPIIKVTENTDLIAIDQLTSLLPRETSLDLSSQLLPFVIDLLQAEIENTPWERSLRRFYEEIEEYEILEPLSPLMAESEKGPAANIH